jgi:phosphoserine phosphatase
LKEWSPQLQLRWEALLNEPPGLVCLDFDNSFIRGDFGEQVMEYLLRNHFPKNMEPILIESLFRDSKQAVNIHENSQGNEWRDYVFQEYNFIRETQGLGPSYRWSSFIFSGWTESKFRELSRKIWLDNLEAYNKDPNSYKTYPLHAEMKVHPREPLLDLVKKFQAKKWNVKIVTASPQWAVEEATPELGLTRSDVLGMILKMNGDLTTHEIIEPYPYGEGKVEAIQKHIGLKCDISFGDTINDYPMLLSAKRQAVLFERGYTELNLAAGENGIAVHPWI